MTNSVTNPKRYAQLAKDRDELDAVIRKLESGGVKTATFATAGASQSVTTLDLPDLRRERDRVNNQMNLLRGAARPLRSFYLNPT